AGTYGVFEAVAGDLSDFAVEKVAFDGSMNYPANDEVYKQDMANVNVGLLLKPDTMSRVRIEGCYFTEFSGHSIETNTDGAADVLIRGNHIYKGSYRNPAIRCRIPSAASDSTRLRRFMIDGNTLDTCGPQAWFDASKEDYVASADGIQVDRALHCIIARNIVRRIGGCGIRVEDSHHVVTIGNTVEEPGQEGITYYKNCVGGLISGNIISGWGRIPNAYGIRSYGGTLVVAREFPRSGGPVLPANPTASQPFEVWPYTTDGIDLGTIIAYDNADYYAGTHDGILPFRGNAAISVVSDSECVTVTGNQARGDLTQDGGKYTHASDFGYSIAHVTNDSAGMTPGVTGRSNSVNGNTMTNCRVAAHYEPAYMDPVALVGQMAPRRALGEYEAGEFNGVLTVGGGSITQPYYKLAYTKIGRVVHVHGECALSGISTPSGEVTLPNLPYPAATNVGQRASRAGFYVRASGLTGVTTGHVVGFLPSGASAAVLQFFEAGAFADLGAKLTAATTFVFDFSYIANA
ncbi:MAG: right-handed parallel beta-helix repeat-containing protein, partial [Pseudomonadota bacterium]|nr:right-handed parallel beta-helix repeat-containing protein [Pseudomonadota bacterium]